MSASWSQYPHLSALLRASYATPKVGPTLQRFVDRVINIPLGIRSKASDSQNHLRELLRAEADRDYTFPSVLAKVDADFLGGSFARHTKIWPLDDIDLYVPLDGANLIYLDNGIRLPYTVLSDGQRIGNPLLQSRWTLGVYVSSTKLIHEFANVLRRHYPRTEVRSNEQAVSIRMTHGETEDEDGLGYDVVPCFSMKPDNPNELAFYLMPDGRNGWIRTNPRIDTEIADLLQRRHNGFYRPVVKLNKYWNSVRLDGAFSSYYIELALARCFLNLTTPITSLSEGLTIGFEALENTYKAGDQVSCIAKAPSVVRPSLSQLQQVTLSLAQIGASLARLNERSGSEGDAVEQWSQVFGEDL